LKNSQKVVLDYQYERKAKDLKRFVDANIPDFVEKVANGSSDFEKIYNKAKKHGLPLAVLFPSKPSTMPLTKFLSIEFRRRLLLAEVKPNQKNHDLYTQLGVDETKLPALVVMLPSKEVIVYEGKDFAKNKLHRFLSEHALKEPVIPQNTKAGEKEATAEQEEAIKLKTTKTEL